MTQTKFDFAQGFNNSITERDYSQIDEGINMMYAKYKAGEISKEDITEIHNNLDDDFLNNTIQGYGLRKPYGYAGDFMMIDKLYTKHISDNEKYKEWDKYFQNHSAAVAVRNRKDYFKKLMKNKCSQGQNIELLNVASGPARDLFELQEEGIEGSIQTTCVDMDSHAIAYAKDLNKKHIDEIKFINQNIFKHREEGKYDVIWSAGLFDYFSDKAFVMVLKKMKNWLSEDGEIVIGNFNEDHNPSRGCMEIMIDWHLNHRTEKQLHDLAIAAGFSEDNVFVGKEPENVNLFLHLKLKSPSMKY